MGMDKSWAMRHWWIFFAAPLAIVVLITIGGEVVMHLWNWLTPTLFGWRQIDLWQAIGLLALCRILFGRWGGGGHGSGGWEKKGRLGRMTPEERENFRRNMRGRWCGERAPEGERGETA
jgi:hypothetical protein